MSRKYINESPTISDKIAFEIRCPLPNNCLPSEQPWKVFKIIIYHIVRDYLNDQVKGFYETKYNQEKLEYAEKWGKKACVNPTTFNIKKAQIARQEVNSSEVTNLFFYNEAVPVKSFGNNNYPPWLRSDPDNAFIIPIETDEEGNTQYGVFELDWEPTGQREGDYFICWSWEQDPGGNNYNQYTLFRIKADTIITTVIPSHQTDPEKYINLMNAYLPEMFTMSISDMDLTPQVLEKLNLATAEHFTEIEDWANQLIDILDANVTNQAFLEILANFFNKKLRSEDPTLWRKQIKKVIPLYKKKGTLESLRDALQEAGITLVKYTPLWQIISSYTWCEAFYITEDAQKFTLEKNPILPITGTTVNFVLQIRGIDDNEWTTLTSDYVTFEYDVIKGITIMKWVGEDLSISPITLIDGDTLKIIYEVNQVPDVSQQALEDYIRSLPLADQRDDRDQSYPLKNWNIRVIEEDDVMFDLIIPTRHPYSPDVVFGQIRTEFPFSENVYNMDEYNGSLRDSTDPCNIDKNFVDCCTTCLSSKFNLDVQIQGITNDRIIETIEIIDEYTPFHAILHTLRFSGLIDEFVNTTIEEVEMLVKYVHTDTVSGGNIQKIFQRSMERESRNAQAGIIDPSVLKRDALANMTNEATGGGNISNQEIVLYTSYVNLTRIGIDCLAYASNPLAYIPGSNSNLLEILSGSNAGNYVVSGKINQHMIKIDQGSPDIIPEFAVSPYLDETEFRFRLSNIKYNNPINNISLDKWVKFTDANIEFENTGVKTQWDVDNDPTYTGSTWQIVTTSPIVDTFDIQKIKPDGSLEFNVTSAQASSLIGNDIEYELQDDNGETIKTSTTGRVIINHRAIVEIIDGSVTDIRQEKIKIGDYCLYDGSQYKIIGFVHGELKKFYIENYTGSAGSNNITIYQRLVEDIGCVGYRGMQLFISGINLEDQLGILNGVNKSPTFPDDLEDNDHLKENYLILLYSGGGPSNPPNYGYYSIEDIDGQYSGINTLITLNGPKEDWSLSGEAKNFTIYHITRKGFIVPDQEEPTSKGYEFTNAPGINRMGADIFTINTQIITPLSSYLSLLNNNNDQIIEAINQDEEITMKIEYKKETNTND